MIGRVLLAGATGLVGRELLALLTSHTAANRPCVVVHRRSVPALEQRDDVELLVREDLREPGPLPPVDAVFIALGTTRKAAGSLDKQAVVDRDMVIAVAREARTAGATRVGVVSASNSKVDSRFAYSRMKGEMEAGVSALGFEVTVFARPSLLRGARHELDQPKRPGEKAALVLTRPIRGLLPRSFRPIDARDVAAALVQAVATAEPGRHRLSNREMLRADRAR